MKKITFKEYLESKEQLRKAIDESPVRTATYIVNKYCKLPVGNTAGDKQYVPLKPKNKIVVEWKYDNIDNPKLMKMRFDTSTVDLDESFSAFWASDRIQRWLNKNTREEL